MYWLSIFLIKLSQLKTNTAERGLKKKKYKDFSITVFQYIDGIGFQGKKEMSDTDNNRILLNPVRELNICKERHL